jgi:acetyltransferase-like isoleucine patch superfamily enzyme
MPIVKKSSFVDVSFGENVIIVDPCNLYGCEIGGGAFIGPFVEIQSNVKIGARSRIQSHTFICTGVEIGEDCFIGHGVMFVNDKWSDGRAMGDKNKWGKTRIEDNVSIGSNSTILPVEICADVVIGAGSVVTKSILRPGKYVGNPAKRLE